jgi:hypothetical protein
MHLTYSHYSSFGEPKINLIANFSLWSASKSKAILVNYLLI